MAVIGTKEMHQRRRSALRDGRWTHTRAFLVTTDDSTDGTARAAKASGIPREGDRFPGSTGFNPPTVVSIDAQPHEQSDKLFLVEVEYQSDQQDFEQFPVHPLDRPATFSYGAESYTEPYFNDRSDPPRPLVNSAGDPFEGTAERAEADITVTMTRNEASFDPVTADAFRMTTNRFPVFVDQTWYAPDTLRLGLATATARSEEWLGNTVNFYEVTRQFAAKRDGWSDKFNDIGYNEIRERIGPSGETIKVRVPILDDTGMRTSRPWPLDGNGRALPSPSGTITEREFRPYASVDWQPLYLT
jgi:hypothetical protein